MELEKLAEKFKSTHKEKLVGFKICKNLNALKQTDIIKFQNVNKKFIVGFFNNILDESIELISLKDDFETLTITIKGNLFFYKNVEECCSEKTIEEFKETFKDILNDYHLFDKLNEYKCGCLIKYYDIEGQLYEGILSDVLGSNNIKVNSMNQTKTLNLSHNIIYCKIVDLEDAFKYVLGLSNKMCENKKKK